MGRFRERHGTSATTWPFWMRVTITAAVAVWPALALLQLVLQDGTARAWLSFCLILGIAVNVVVLRSVWTLSDDAVRDDNLGSRLSTRLSRSLDEQARDEDPERRPTPIAEREPPRRW